jgi:hypothetical protein
LRCVSIGSPSSSWTIVNTTSAGGTPIGGDPAAPADERLRCSLYSSVNACTFRPSESMPLVDR